MRVLMLSTDASIFESGSESYSRMKDYGTLTERLDIIVCTVGVPKQELLVSDVVRAIPTNSSSKLWYVRDILHAAKRRVLGGVDLVTSQDPFETGLAGWLAARRLKAKLQLQVHTDFLSPYFARESFKNFIRVRIAKWLLPKADSIRVVSERVKRSLGGIVPDMSRVHVLPIFVGTGAHASSGIDLHKQYPQFEAIILMVSRLEPEKNINLAISSFVEVAQKHPQVGLVIVGTGSQEPPLKQLVQKLGLSDSVVFAGRTEDVSVYYKTADLFLNTSNYEGYGRTLIEAASAGLSIITTDVGAVGEIINKENSLVIPVGDTKALVMSMLKLINDKSLRQELVQKARDAIQFLDSKDSYLQKYQQSWRIPL